MCVEIYFQGIACLHSNAMQLVIAVVFVMPVDWTNHPSQEHGCMQALQPRYIPMDLYLELWNNVTHAPMLHRLAAAGPLLQRLFCACTASRHQRFLCRHAKCCLVSTKSIANSKGTLVCRAPENGWISLCCLLLFAPCFVFMIPNPTLCMQPEYYTL